MGRGGRLKKMESQNKNRGGYGAGSVEEEATASLKHKGRQLTTLISDAHDRFHEACSSRRSLG